MPPNGPGPSVSGRSAQDPITLRLWVFKFNQEFFQVTVEGYFPCDDQGTLRNWGTSAIKKRHKNTLLESESGKYYKLIGEIDESSARTAGYPLKLIQCFKHGFPPNWEKLLREYYNVVKTTNPLNASVWFEKNHRRESMSALRDEPQNGGGGQASAALRRRQSRLSVMPSVPVIEENSFEADESVKENRAKTPKSVQHKAVTDTIESGGPLVRRSPRLAICDTPHNIGEQKKDVTAEATLEVVDTPRRGRPPKKNKEAAERTASATPAATPTKKGTRTPRGTTPAVSTPRASRSATRERTPAIIPATSKSTPRPAASKSRDVTPAKTPKSTPRKSAAAAATTPQPQEPAPVADTPTSSRNVDNNQKNRGLSIDAHIAKKSPKTLLIEDTPILAATPPVHVALPSANDDSMFKMPEMPAKKKQRSSTVAVMGNAKPQTLDDWYFRFVPELENKSKEHPPFIVIGMNTDKPEVIQEWSTTIIARVSPDGRSFFTFRGSEYRIHGEINVTAMAKEGFTRTITAEFYNGFPANWVQTLWTAYNLKKGLPVDADPNQPIVTHPNSDGEASHRSNRSLNSNKSKKRRSNPADLSLVPFDQTRLSGEVKTSAKGRVVKPVMPAWAGQRVRYSVGGDVMGVETSVIHCEEAVDMNSFADHFGVPRVEEAPSRKRRSFTGALRVEMGGRERVQPKKRLVTYSSSSSGDDSDAVTRTLRMIDYDHMPMVKHRRGAKARRLNEETDSEEEREQEEKMLRRIAKRKRKAIKDLSVLEKLQQKVLAKREQRRLQRKTVQNARRREEDYELEQMELERKQKQRMSLHAQKKKQQKKAPKRQVFEEETSEDDLFEGSSSGDSGDSSSTETEVSDDGGEWVRTPAQKRGGQRIRQKKASRKGHKKAQSRGGQKQRKNRVMESEDDLEDEEEEEEEIVRKERKQKVKKPMWNQTDRERLKLALSASNVRTDEDWEVIARSLGGLYPAEDCKEMAIKKLKWKEAPAADHGKKNGDSDEEGMRVTARQGTVAYQIQADQQSRKYMMGAGSQGEDCFRNKEMREEEDDFFMPDVGEFDPDDSLLEALKTPTQAAPVGRKGANRRPFIAGPLIGDDDTPTVVKRRSSTVHRNEEMDSAERENHQRRLRHLMHDKRNLSHASRMNNTSMMQNHSMADQSRVVLNVERKFDRIKKKYDQQKPKKKREFDEEDEEEEEEEEC